jgi:hypothetical protein
MLHLVAEKPRPNGAASTEKLRKLNPAFEKVSFERPFFV